MKGGRGEGRGGAGERVVSPPSHLWRRFKDHLHYEKSLFVLASHQKIPLPRIENLAVDTRTFFPLPIVLDTTGT
jgi:hypothetical protein